MMVKFRCRGVYMMTRRQFAAGFGFIIAGMPILYAQQAKPDTSLVTVTLIIDGMT
jgi:hypothetical protein